MEKDKNLYHLIDHLVKTINLPDFIEKESDRILKWKNGNQSASCHCPMPNHNDRNASFHITQMPEGIWIYNCFGCNSKGHIIHFCMDYYGLRNKYESILYICKKFNIKNKEDLIIESLKKVSKRVDVQRKMENSNILVSNQCRMLLRKDFNLHNKWVSEIYKKLNAALDNEDYDAIESIDCEASNRNRGI